MAVARATIRREIRARRRGLGQDERRAAAVGLARAATGRLLRRGRRIAFYLANDGEIDVAPLLAKARATGCHTFLPVLDNTHAARLQFMAWSPGEPLVTNRFGIGEPAGGPALRVAAGSLDVIVIPLVAFDDRGGRLGMGGGFYDRTLAYLNRRSHWRRPRLIGAAYEFQQVAGLEPAPWDVPLDGCLTERGLRLFPRARTPRSRR